MKLPRNAKIFRGQLDAAPFAGVVFLLLIFLALNSRLVFDPGVKIELPEVRGPLSGTLNPTVIVAVDAAGLLHYDGQNITEEKLLARLQALRTNAAGPITLEILADKSSHLEVPLRLMSLAKEIGFPEVLLNARPAIRPIPPIQPPPR